MNTYKPLNTFRTMAERDTYVKGVMLEEGLEVINNYRGSSRPLNVRILTGEYKGYIGTIKWNNFTQGKRPDFRSLLEEEKVKYIKDVFEPEGYQVVHIPKPIRRGNKIDLISPEGNEWSVAIDTFIRGIRCPLDSSISWGERCIGTILVDNNIEFKHQKSIMNIEGNYQFLDFYIEDKGYKYAIEYNGRQHYIEDTGSIFAPLREQQRLDKLKREYCRNNNIELIEIPYTFRDVTDIAKELSKFFSIDTDKDYKVKNFNNDTKIIEYYKNNTEKETGRRFGIAGSTVRSIFYRNGYRKRSNYNEEEVIDYYRGNSAYKTADKFNISVPTVYGLARKHRIRKPRQYTDQQVIDYYMGHSLKETQEKFGIGVTTVTTIMRRNGASKTERRRLS